METTIIGAIESIGFGVLELGWVPWVYWGHIRIIKKENGNHYLAFGAVVLRFRCEF